jgi:nucleotide-binding universal stress UspA family protein
MSTQYPASSGVVVVGVDGSEESKDALRWAIRHARMSGGTTVRAVTVWHYPAGFGWVPPPPAPEMNPKAAALQALKQTIEQVVGTEEAITVRPEVVSGPTALMLLQAAEDADLLVVGSRGRGAFAGMLLGSVSTHCVHHAACSVVVVRTRATTAEQS